MLRTKILAVIAVLMLLFTSLNTALANKQVYKAALRTSNELHQVVGSNASGNAVIGTNPDGSLHILLFVRGLSGPPSGAHIHGPATTAQNAGVLVTLCGGPAPAMAATCPFDASTSTMTLEGDIPATLVQGVTPPTFISHLRGGLTYINVHTALNPAGETRGQIIPQ
jgi:Cu/Zn superoxide dismutase